MKISYYPETDSMYIELSLRESVESKEVSEGIVLDFDSNGNITGIDIDIASLKLDLKELILSKIPADKHTIAA